jgi:hypothetical protein
MLTLYRITLASLALAAVGAVHASEATEFPLEKSTLSRAEVQAEARQARSMPGELYDGTQYETRMPTMTTLTRVEVRMQAQSTRTLGDDYTGG